MNTTKTSFFICLLGYLFIGFFPPQAVADTVTNDNYSVDVGNIDTNPQPTPKLQVLGTNIVKPKDFTTGTNYTVNSSDDLTIELSQNTIDYGILSSTNPVIRTSGISLISKILGGEIISYENFPLTMATDDVIQNTSCDNGACTPETAALWTNTLTYGFGYRCDSQQENVCDLQFSTPNYFKTYPDNATADAPQPIMVTTPGKSKGTITYKVNISGTQKAGGYYNSITYLAVPSF